MVDLVETAHQLVMTSVLGLVTKVLSILLSNWLDKYMNHSLSNFIGLIVNATLDFWMMKRVFKVEEMESSQFFVKYTVSILVAILVAQLLYMSVAAYTKKYHNEWYKTKWNKYVFWIRYAVGAVAYGFFEFPMHKFWVFKK